MTLLEKIKEKDCRVIVCNVDGISGYFFKTLIQSILGEESYWEDYSLVHSLYPKVKEYLEADVEEISDSEILDFWIEHTNYPIISTCWSYERTIQAALKSNFKDTVRIYNWMPCTTVYSKPF